MKNKDASFSYITTRFFQVYLPGERGYSEATIASYLDTFKQLLVYCKETLGKSPDKLAVSDVSKDVVLGFLKKLEDDGKSVSTRNQRLAAIKCFFRFIEYSFPEYLDTSSMVVGIKMKKQSEAVVNYMSVDGVSCVLNQPDMKRRFGYRDALILTILYLRRSPKSESEIFGRNTLPPSCFTEKEQRTGLYRCPVKRQI